MSKGITNFAGMEVDKHKFHHLETLILLEDVVIQKIN